MRALAVDAGLVYAGGEFTSAGGRPRARLAALDGAGTATAWDPGADRPVSALAVGPGSIFVGGEFALAGGRDRRAIAELAKAGGEATAWQGMADGDRIDALALDGGTLLAGGGGLWALSTADGRRGTWTPTANVGVRAVLAAGPAVLAGGTGDASPESAGGHRFLAAYTSPPVAGAAPAIEGAGREGAGLICTPGTWANHPASFAYTWLRDGAVEVGTGAAYRLRAGDGGSELSCRVSAANAGGFASAVSAGLVLAPMPVSTAPPVVSLAGDRSAACTGDAWTVAVTRTYAWLRDGAPIAGADAAALDLTDADAGTALTCRVTAATGFASVAATSTPIRVPLAPVPPAAPSPAAPAPPVPRGPGTSPPRLRIPAAGWRTVDGRVRAPAIRCPASAGRCRAGLTLRIGGIRLATARVVLAGGAVARPVVRVPARLRRTLRGRRVQATVTLTAQDAAGRRVTVRRTVVLRAT